MGREYNLEIKAVVTTFNLDEAIFKDLSIKYKRFRGPSASWFSFVKNNSQGVKNPKGDHNLDFRYDLVIGYTATMETVILCSYYENGLIDETTYKNCLKAIKKTNQYS